MVRQPGSRAANTLSISRERIFMLVFPKIFLVMITHSAQGRKRIYIKYGSGCSDIVTSALRQISTPMSSKAPKQKLPIRWLSSFLNKISAPFGADIENLIGKDQFDNPIAANRCKKPFAKALIISSRTAEHDVQP